jgi:group I intron endonuclease
MEKSILSFPSRNAFSKARFYTCFDCRDEILQMRNAPNNIYCFIYVVKNSINNKVYVGQTWRGISVRWQSHLQTSTENHCLKLRRAIKKYGAQNFLPELLILCHTQEVADLWEKEFIAKFDSIQNGYNILEGGSGISRKGTKHSEETKRLFSITRVGELNANAILTQPQVDRIRDEYVGFTNPRTGSKYGALSFLAKKFGVSVSAIFEAVNRQSWK